MAKWRRGYDRNEIVVFVFFGPRWDQQNRCSIRKVQDLASKTSPLEFLVSFMRKNRAKYSQFLREFGCRDEIKACMVLRSDQVHAPQNTDCNRAEYKIENLLKVSWEIFKNQGKNCFVYVLLMWNLISLCMIKIQSLPFYINLYWTLSFALTKLLSIDIFVNYLWIPGARALRLHCSHTLQVLQLLSCRSCNNFTTGPTIPVRQVLQ